jgi:hypothetical protein
VSLFHSWLRDTPSLAYNFFHSPTLPPNSIKER